MLLVFIILLILLVLATYPKFPSYTYETENFIITSPDGMGIVEKVQVWKNVAGDYGDLISEQGNEPLLLKYGPWVNESKELSIQDMNHLGIYLAEKHKLTWEPISEPPTFRFKTN